MKTKTLFKVLTVVGLFVLGYEIKAESCSNTLGVSLRTNCDTLYKAEPEKMKACALALECLQSKKEDDDKAKQEEKEAKVECKQALKDYDDAMKKTDEECNRMSVEKISECRERARQCSKGLDSFQSENGDTESATASIVKMIGIYGQMQGSAAGNPNVAAGCVLENDDKAAEKEERIDDKITKIREEIQDLKEKATEADNKLNEKKQDVDKEMLDVEKDADKAKFEKQTKTQEEAGRMQKAVMNSEKKRRDNLLRIADLEVDMANFSFAHQKLNLALSDNRITKECRDKSIAAMNAKVKGSVDPKTGKIFTPKFSQQESLQFRKDLKSEESNCLQEKALQRQETTKALIDAKRKVKVQVDTLTASNTDEEKAIAADLKQMESLKAIATEEEKKDIDNKLKKLNSLNKSVTDMEKHIVDKKKSYEEKSKAKEDQISKLLLDRQNVKPKFAKVSSTVEVSGRAASVYLNQCCAFADKAKNHSDCSRVTSVEPEAKTRATVKTTPAVKK